MKIVNLKRNFQNSLTKEVNKVIKYFIVWYQVSGDVSVYQVEEICAHNAILMGVRFGWKDALVKSSQKGSKYGGYMVENQEQDQEQEEEEKLVKIQQCVIVCLAEEWWWSEGCDQHGNQIELDRN